MANKDIERKIKNAFSKTVPDVLDSVLQQCSEQKGTVIEMTENKKKKTLVYKIAAIAAAFVVLLGGTAAALNIIGNNSVETTVFLDVNPSVEILLNRDERVLEVNALNSDGEIIIGDMDFQGADLEVSVNALIGSMLKNGYLSEIANSILVSVDNGDPQKASELQQRLVEEINDIIGGSSIDGSILSQTISHDSKISSLAEQYGISYSKAQLISDILEKNSLLTFEDLAGTSINELNVLRQSDGIKNDNLQVTGTPSTESYIGEQKAWTTAVQHAADNTDNNEIKDKILSLIPNGNDFDISSVPGKVKLDIEDGKMVYEIEFNVSKFEYEYEIDAITGDIINFDKEVDDDYKSSEKTSSKTTSDTNSKTSSKTSSNTSSKTSSTSNTSKNTTTTNSKTTSYIGEQKAKEIALNHAGVSESSTRELEVDLDRENGTVIYEISFDANDYEYDYEINAVTGKVERSDKEADDDYRTVSSSSKTASKITSSKTPSSKTSSLASSKTSTSYIGEQKAKEIALNHAGVSENDARELEAELDRENGTVIYEISFDSNGYEYDYEINALTGEIIHSDKERD